MNLEKYIEKYYKLRKIKKEGVRHDSIKILPVIGIYY